MEKVHFIPGVAKAYLIHRARQKGFQGRYGEIRSGADLQRARILRGSIENVSKLLNGHVKYPVTSQHEAHIRRILGLSATAWWLITKRADTIDGPEVRRESIANPTALCAKLIRSRDPVALFVRDRLRDITNGFLAKWDSQRSPPVKLIDALVEDLNVVLKGELIWDTDRFANVTIREEASALIHCNPVGDGRTRLNRVLLEDAFKDELARVGAAERTCNSANAQIERPSPSLPAIEAPMPTQEEVEILQRFLQGYKREGLVSVLAFFPRNWNDDEWPALCIPARVITEQEWSDFQGGDRSRGGTPAEEVVDAIAQRATGVLFNGWLRRAHKRVVLKGEPGEGKTTAIWLFARELLDCWIGFLGGASGERSTPPTPFPLILPLGGLRRDREDDRSLLQHAVDYAVSVAGVDEAEVDAVAKWIRRLYEAGRCVFLLDGLDEMLDATAPWLRRQLRSIGEIPAVISTRYHADPGMVLQHYTIVRMVPLRWWMIDAFVTNYFAGSKADVGRAAALRARLRALPSLRQLARNPLLLAAVCFLHLDRENRGGRAARSRTEILEQALHTLLARGAERRGEPKSHGQREAQKIDVLAALAWEFQRERAWPITELGAVRLLERVRSGITIRTPESGDALLSELLNDGVLVRRGDGNYDFLVRRMREYCLARRVAQMAEEDTDSGGDFRTKVLGRFQALRPHARWVDFRPLNQPGWIGVWPLTAGCLRHNPALLDALIVEWRSHEDIASGRLRLVAESFGEAFGDEGLDCPLWHSHRESILQVVREVTELAVADLARIGQPYTWRTCLARLPWELVVRPLVERITEAIGCDGKTASLLLALGEVGTESACQHLVEWATDSSLGEEVRANACAALGLVGDAEARDNLLRLLKESEGTDEVIHFECLVGLGLIGDELSRKTLAEVLQSSDTSAEARLKCLEACEHLFGPEIEKKVLQLLERCANAWPNPIPGIRGPDAVMQRAADILGRIGGPGAGRRLMDLLERDLPEGVAARIAAAVAETGDLECRNQLRAIADDKTQPRNRSGLARVALVGAGDESVLGDLIETDLEQEDSIEFATSIIQACSNSKRTSVSRFLASTLLAGLDFSVQLAAARALSQRDDPCSLKAMQEAVRGDSPREVRFECLRGLALCGDAKARKELRQLAEDPNTEFRHRAVAIHCLAQIGDAESRDALIRLYQDNAHFPPLRLRCEDALAMIQRETGWRFLVAGAWESP